jgi:single-stranded-DNA-specific exonuclease
MRKSHRWQIASPHPSADTLARDLRTSPLIAQILLNRQIDTPIAGQAFLSPKLTQLIDPAKLPGLTRAADRIARAIRDREPIVIYGDYDVDGITASTILWHAIRILGGSARYYIPHRIEEGYGLNTDAVRQLISDGAKLIITVDCGVTALEPAEVARDAGVDLVITDHHEWRLSPDGAPVLPQCCAIVHPRLPGEAVYENPHLCGAGVAFKLAWGIGQAVCGSSKVSNEFRAFLLDATALAALGTIADVVPLVDENRVLARFGLSGLKASKLTGIQSLIRSAGLDGQNIDSIHVGFLLGPRLNACGRMGHAEMAVEMMTTASPERADEIATFLEAQNRQRQQTERKIVDEAIEQIVSLQLDGPDARAIVVGGEGWHPGVIGIVASRIVDRYHRPAIVVALGEGHGHGSGRSIAGFHLARALEACSTHLISSGGHEMAAGLRIEPSRFEAFREAFLAHAATSVSDELLIPELRIDCEAALEHINAALVKDLERLGPFGQGNPRPLLACRDLELAAEPRRVGRNGDHLQLFVRQRGTAMKAIAFGAGDLFDELRPGRCIHLAVQPQLNEWNGRVSVELEVKAVQIG